jgi:hypothetical protein
MSIYSMSVANIEIDITNYSGMKDFAVTTEYLDANNYNVVVTRLDSSGDGWTEGLKVFVSYTEQGKTDTIQIGSSKEQVKKVQVTTEFPIASAAAVVATPTYTLKPYPEPQFINRKQFNKLFNTDIVTLPKNIIAVGVRKNCVYLYCESNEFLYMIELTIKHIVQVALTKDILNEFYFLICTHDGYMERHYLSNRTKPKEIGENELKGKVEVIMDKPDEYAKLHKGLYVLSQSNQKGMSYTVNVPDRYYFYLNRYNEYHSIHQGIPFASKKSQIVFGSQPRGTKYNFTTRRDIEVSPREYFNKSVPKDNIVCPDWIPRKDMIGYKYILDIDGFSSTWDATAWKLNSGSVILKSDSVWSQWFHGEYQPWSHYVPVADDFRDIQEKFQWCESHQAECVQMVANCKALFQKAYRLTNVIDSTLNSLYKINNLVPYYLDSRRIFFFRNCDNEMPNLNAAKQESRGVGMIDNITRKLKPTDIMVFINPALTDMNNFDLRSFMNAYDSFDKKIVFGAEKNLWPGDLEQLRYKIESVSNSTNDFKYLNAGFYIAEVGEMTRLLDECVHEPEHCEPDFFSRAFVTKRYSFTLDTEQKLVLNTYRCSKEEIEAKKAAGVPFINYNAGR